MFKNIKFNEKLQTNFLVKEHRSLIDFEYIKKSEFSYNKQNSYLNKFVFKDVTNNKCFLLNKDIVKDFNNYKNLTYLRTKELERICNEEKLEPVFITLTLPSKFHPFKKSNEYFSLNSNFEFVAIEQRINEGYKELNKIYREFYLNVKNNKKNKGLKYIKIIEPHKSLIPHLHRILYINKDTFESFKNQFGSITKKYKLKQTKIEKLNEARGSSYIIKYILKNFNDKEIKQLDGWKKLHKIRIFTMSNLPLSTDIFKKLYYSNKELNLQILTDIKKGVSKYKNLFQYYSKNTTIERLYINNYGEIIKEVLKNKSKKNRFKFTKIIQIKELYRIEKKEVKQKENLLKTFEILKEIYFNNKFKQFKEFYKIKQIEKNHFLTKEKLFLIDIFKEIQKTISTKYYKTFDYIIFDNILKKDILEKNKFMLESIKFD